MSRRRNRRADRRAARQERRTSRRANKQTRKDSRRLARLERQAGRQDARGMRQSGRQATKQAAYAAGIDPNSWLGSVGNTISSVADSRSERLQAEAYAEAWDGTGTMPTAADMSRKDLQGGGSNNIMLIAIAGLVAFMMMK